jgi:DNA polymerase elongation subunit (family B)
VLPHQDNIDLIVYFKRFYQGKQFTSYKLDDVSETVLGKKKSPFEVYKIHKFYSELYAGSNEISLLDVLCRYMEIDSQLPLELFYRLNILNLVNVLSILTFCNTRNIFGPISVVSINCVLYRLFYPEKKPFSYERNILTALSYNPPEKNGKKKITYQGAHIIEPIAGIYTNVMVFDYASLYPSNIIKYNISPTYLFTICKFQYGSNKSFFDEHFNVIDMTSHFNMTPKKETTPLASIEAMLMDQRAIHKRMIPRTPYDTVMEQAYKLLSNSLYGLTGAQTFISDQNVAATVTAYGRQSLQRCESFFKSINFEVIYGDTDSVFVCEKEKDNCRVYSDEYTSGLIETFYSWNNSKFPKLEMEDIFETLIIVSKKCYIGLRNNENYKIVGFQKKVPLCISIFVDDIIDYIFKINNNNPDNFHKWIKERIQYFIQLTNEKEKFVQMKKVKTNLHLYSKKCNQPQLVFARELKQRGVDLSTFDGHIYYVNVIKDITSKYLGAYYELSKDVANLTIDLHSFVSGYIGKIKSLLKVVYGLNERYLDRLFVDATNEMKITRFNTIKTKLSISILNLERNNRGLQQVPDVRQFFRNWYDFAIRYHLFPNKDDVQNKTKICLKWIPKYGFTYLDTDHISEWKSLVVLEKYITKTFKIQPHFRVSIETDDWTIKDFLVEILNLKYDDVCDKNSDVFVTRYGVFDIKTKTIYDCVEKLL